MIGLIEISVIEEANPRLLSFEQDRQDYLLVPPELASNVLDPGNKLKQRFVQRGIGLERDVQPVITGLAFNMEDPVVGGYDHDRIALRRAIAMTYDAEEDARVIRRRGARRGARRSSFRPTSADTIPSSRSTSGATSQALARCSTSSATSIATATGCARRPTAGR